MSIGDEIALLTNLDVKARPCIGKLFFLGLTKDMQCGILGNLNELFNVAGGFVETLGFAKRLARNLAFTSAAN